MTDGLPDHIDISRNPKTLEWDWSIYYSDTDTFHQGSSKTVFDALADAEDVLHGKWEETP